MRFERCVVVVGVVLGGCGDDRETGSGGEFQALEERIVGTTWTCDWLVLMVDADDRTHAFPAEVEHTLSIGASTLNDDLPYRLVEWSLETEDNWRASAAYTAGFTGLGRDVQVTMDDVAWRQTGNDEIMFATLDTLGHWTNNAFMSFQWSGDGVWVGTSFAFGARSWCEPVAQ